MKFRAFGVRFYVSMPFTAVLCAMILLDKTGLLPATFFAALLHELGHLAAMMLCGVRPDSVRFYVGAVGITRPRRVMGKRRELLISFSGPAVNLLMGMFMLLAQQPNHACIQLSVGGFNLLPVIGLDGGSGVELLTGSRRAVTVTTVCTLVLISAMLLRCPQIRPSGTGWLFALLYIAAMQLLCARREQK